MKVLLPPANEVWGKVIFLHQFVILFTGGACVVAPGGGHAWLLLGGHAWLLWGGMHGCSWGVCVVAPGGHAWLLGGACMVAPGGMHDCSGGHAWFYLGACVVLFKGGMRGFIQGGRAWFYSGGACMVFSVFPDTMRYGQWAGGTYPTWMHSCFTSRWWKYVRICLTF